MSIQDFVGKIKALGYKHRPNIHIIPDDLFLGLIIILVAFGSFGLGRLSKIEGSKVPIRVVNAPEIGSETLSGKVGGNTQGASVARSTKTNKGDLVASKNGTRYYYPWCSGVSRISPANMIYFSSKAEAEAQGYTASATCKGL